MDLLKGQAQTVVSMYDIQNPNSTFEQVKERIEDTLCKDQDLTSKLKFQS